MSKQPPPAPTASAIGPCPTIIQISRTPRHWKFTQHLRTTRPPPGAIVLGNFLVPGRPTNFDYSRARAFCTCRRCGWGGLDIFSLIYHFSLLSPSLWETARYRLKYCLRTYFEQAQSFRTENASACCMWV